MYLDTKGIVHNKELLSDILNRINGVKLRCLLNSYSLQAPWSINMSEYSCGIIILNYHPDGTLYNNTYIYSFVKLNSNIALNLIASHIATNNAAPTVSTEDATININKATWGGLIRVFYLGI